MSTYTNNFGNTFTFVTKDNGNIEWRGNFIYVKLKYVDNPDIITKIIPGGNVPTLEVGDDMADHGLTGTISGFTLTDYGWEIEIA